MSIIEVVSIVGVVSIGVGLGITWTRNGKAQARREGEYSQTVKNIDDKLGDVCAKADETNQKLETMKTHCAASVSTFEQQITTLFHNQDKIEKRVNTFDRRKPE